VSEAKVNDELQDETVTKVADGEASDNNELEADNDVQAEDGVRNVEQELAEAKDQIAELHDRMLRAAAENENFKKRVERERLASLKYAGEAILREMLPTVDNLERALNQGVIEGADAEKNLSALLEGVQLTLKSLLATLEKFEVKPVDSVGEPFDPKHQEALTMDSHDTIPENHVITDFEKGYYYKDRLLRAAKVVVSSGKKA
jgi:molecular chaperone GrpE